MIRSKIKSLLRSLGFEVSTYCIENSRVCRLGTRLKVLGVDLVLDVGANVGQFAQDLRHSGYQGRIISFEPLSSAYHDLLINSKDDSMWQIAPRCALGAFAEQSVIKVSKNTWSSSILSITERHIQVSPNAGVIGSEPVSIMTLDELALTKVYSARRPYLKIDTQGYERQVLDGAKKAIPYLAGMQLELSMAPLYEKQPDFIETIEWIQEMGFELFGLEPEFYDPQTSRLLQVDAIFQRRYLNE